MKHLRLSPVILLFASLALLAYACTKEENAPSGDSNQNNTNTPSGPNDPDTPAGPQNTITLDFSAAFPHHTEVSAHLTLLKWNAETQTFDSTPIDCAIAEGNVVYTITSSSSDKLTDGELSYIDISNYPKTFHLLFGPTSGQNKTDTVSFANSVTYAWNDNGQYMVLRD